MSFITVSLSLRYTCQTHERRSTRCTCRYLRSALVKLACCVRRDTRHASYSMTPIASSQLTLKQCSSGTDLSTGTSRLTLFGKCLSDISDCRAVVYPNARLNALLEAVCMASMIGICRLITSTYGLPLPSFFGVFPALSMEAIGYRRKSAPGGVLN